ncbi:bZIP transcription factor HapX [Cladophialophora carrionii]|uniref:BZIP transcription factor HapX n=1 Tax=Cladophialophora carrionii TaxID=86049 RepID=A0A1C1CBD3_9EURO|nr:bZIP transcription factor HapX [Cladophialophora carrionii]
MASKAASPMAASPGAAQVDVKPTITRQPSLCMKPAQTPPACSPPAAASSAPLSLTTKEWVVPPRPKPGRKPATDTPPTKRKAQNRAAQRAFRERRAARVGELEETLKQIEEENEHEQEVLRATVDKLGKELEQCRTDLTLWIDRCRKLESELAAFKKPTSTSKPTTSTQDKSDPAASDTSIGCGNCTLETRCQCIDDAFAAMSGNSASVHQHEKRPHSPSHTSVTDKRIKLEPRECLEIDFTGIYTSSKSPATAAGREENNSPTSAVADPCGFCSDGTPCICAEVAAEQEQQQAQSNATAVSSISRAAARQLDQFTPPPSEGDVSMPVSATAAEGTSGCGASGPGTCAQCRADPNSTLFCKSLAASRAQSTATSSGCCGAQTPGSSCCRATSTSVVALRGSTRTTRSRAAAVTLPLPQSVQHAPSGVTLTCADAYTTLSRHPAYERAAGEIGEWLPKLHATEPGTNVEGRPALEIDAANVMAVLRDFDRRFGKSC